MQITETTVNVHAIVSDERMNQITYKFNWRPEPQYSGNFTIFENSSGDVGLFLSQENANVVRVGIRSLAHATNDELDSRLCASLHDALGACHSLMGEYAGYDVFSRNNRM